MQSPWFAGHQLIGGCKVISPYGRDWALSLSMPTVPPPLSKPTSMWHHLSGAVGLYTLEPRIPGLDSSSPFTPQVVAVSISRCNITNKSRVSQVKALRPPRLAPRAEGLGREECCWVRRAGGEMGPLVGAVVVGGGVLTKWRAREPRGCHCSLGLKPGKEQVREGADKAKTQQLHSCLSILRLIKQGLCVCHPSISHLLLACLYLMPNRRPKFQGHGAHQPPLT